MTGIAGILLAAGSARRFGAHKLMHPLEDGTPIGVAAARVLVQVLPDSIAVVRADDDPLVESLSAVGLRIVVNPLPDRGMGTSVAAGVGFTANASGWLIALADMPWVQAGTLRALVDRLHHGASLVAPVHAGRRGNPVGFSARWGGRLQGLSGDQGARGLLASHAEELELVETPDTGVLADVDCPTDLIRMPD